MPQSRSSGRQYLVAATSVYLMPGCNARSLNPSTSLICPVTIATNQVGNPMTIERITVTAAVIFFTLSFESRLG